MVGLRDAGKVRFIGISNHQAEHLERIEPIGHVDTLQPPLSLINRNVLDATMHWCAEHGTGSIVYSPMQAGILTGRWDHARRDALAPDDWRRRSGEYRSPAFERNLDLVARLQPPSPRSSGAPWPSSRSPGRCPGGRQRRDRRRTLPRPGGRLAARGGGGARPGAARRHRPRDRESGAGTGPVVAQP
jgi:hypothetical protein